MDSVRAFLEIRDIPYRIPLSIDEADHCCSGKAMQLAKFFKEADCPSRYRVCEFLWSSMSLPEELINIAHEDVSTHVFLEVFLEGKWIVVDPTWDEGLRSVFPVNDWDGRSDTIIAVPVKIFFSYEESDRIMTQTSSAEIEDDLKKNGLFYNAFNFWLETVRNSSR